MFVALGLVVAGSLITAGRAGAQDGGGPAPSEPALTFTVRDRNGTQDTGDDELVEGATIVVLDASGASVAEVTTDGDGRAVARLPGEGRYTATLDLGSLPEGVGPPREGGEVIEVDPNRARVANFTLGDRVRVERTFVDELKQTTVDGIRFGLVVALCSVGLSLVFGTTGLTNFAHGELVTFGAVVVWFMVNDHGVNLVLATVVGLAVGAAFGAGLERGLWRPLRRRGLSLLAMMVVSIGLSFLLRYLLQIWFGAGSEPYAQFSVGHTSTYDLLGVRVSATALVSIVASLVVLVSVGLLLQLTRIGKAMRAVADSPDLAASSGIDVDHVVLVVWALGGALAALGGVFHGLAEQVKFDFGNDILLLMFAGIVLGGLGTAYGALVGGFLVGLLVQLSTIWVTPNLKTVGALVVMVAVLLVRPQGILGRAERVG
ncbi:MAG: branched-chain amino acid ABC transporter permease [Acidimicrobiia bacterium]